jgi:hypothetical protein
LDSPPRLPAVQRRRREETVRERPLHLGHLAGASYAAEQPIKPAREGKDPTGWFAPKAAAPAKAATGGWTRVDGAELPDAEPIERPPRAVKARLKAGGLVHDPCAGSYLATLVADFGGVAAGGLVFRPADRRAVFVTAAPVAPGLVRLRQRRRRHRRPRRRPCASAPSETSEPTLHRTRPCSTRSALRSPVRWPRLEPCGALADRRAHAVVDRRRPRAPERRRARPPSSRARGWSVPGAGDLDGDGYDDGCPSTMTAGPTAARPMSPPAWPPESTARRRTSSSHTTGRTTTCSAPFRAPAT